mmetsp:Transcript_17441/g.49524  ORF Transcript_17441/g.49524 Transcript_17441/m.49524 type:complete len:510 (+) Transcript_17441:95-1624(+)
MAMQRVRDLAKRSAKIGAFCGVVAGGTSLTFKVVNDDLDDVSYAIRKRFYPAPAVDERKKVVVLGSGWGAMAFVRKLDPDLYNVTMVSPRPFFFYTPLLVGSTTGVVSPGAIIEPIRDVTQVDLLRVECRDVDLKAKKVHCDQDLTLDYDHLVVAVGAQPNTFGIPGVDKHAFFMKEIEHGRAVRKHMLDVIDRADVAMAAGRVDEVKKMLNFVVVGGGPTGVEFCGELSDFISMNLKKRYPRIAEHFKVTLVEALPSLLTMFDKSISSYVHEHLVGQGVDIRLNAAVKEVTEDVVQVKNKDGSVDTMEYGALVWVAGVGMRPFTKALCEQIGTDNGQTDRRGLLVDECLRVKGTPPGEVFAIGDCAVSGNPPTAQVAFQQGKYLGKLFRRGSEDMLASPETKGFSYMHQGAMAYIGKGEAATQLDPNGILKLGKGSITDHIFWRSLYGETDQLRVGGLAGFAIWRSVYYLKLMSARNCWAVGSDWMRTTFFGRPASSSAQGTYMLAGN